MKKENLRKLRVSLGLTQGGCARDMGVSRQTVYNLETNPVSKEASLKYYELYLKDVKRRRDYAQSKRRKTA